MTNRRTLQRRSAARLVGFTAWVAAVALFLLWQAAKYQGFMSLVGEWQYNAFGRHYWTFNYVFAVTLLSLPGYLIFLKPRAPAESDRPEALLYRSAQTFLRVLVGAAATLGGLSLLTLLLLLLLPSNKGNLQRIDVTRAAVAQPREGLTELSGTILYERTAGFDEDLAVAKRTFRFAPVVGGRRTASELRFFIQFPPDDGRVGTDAVQRVGVLKRNGLPGEIMRLYRYAGYTIEQPHYVLFAEPAAMRWPYLITAAQLLIAALLAAALALVQRRRVQQIDQRVHGEVTPNAR